MIVLLLIPVYILTFGDLSLWLSILLQYNPFQYRHTRLWEDCHQLRSVLERGGA
jgi:hypothetical protein